MARHSIIAAGTFTCTFIHDDIAGGNPVTMVGYKLEGAMVETAQYIDSSKVVPLIRGSVSITNENDSGTLTITSTLTDKNARFGDLVAYVRKLKAAGSSLPLTVKITQDVNGETLSWEFISCTVKSVAPLHIAGNDVADYPIELYYGECKDPFIDGEV